jgi:hypothetical protein
MIEDVQKLVDKIKNVIQRENVQPGYPDANGNTNVIWCNRAANYIATELGFDMSPFLEPKGINWTTANMMYSNAILNGKEIDGQEAQKRANQGEVILAACYNSKGSGHVAIVCPSEEKYDNAQGPLVGEAGTRCRITYTKEAFEKWGYIAKFFVIPKKGI